MKEDRALRDSARALFRDELKHVRREATPGAIGVSPVGCPSAAMPV